MKLNSPAFNGLPINVFVPTKRNSIGSGVNVFVNVWSPTYVIAVGPTTNCPFALSTTLTIAVNVWLSFAIP